MFNAKDLSVLSNEELVDLYQSTKSNRISERRSMAKTDDEKESVLESEIFERREVFKQLRNAHPQTALERVKKGSEIISDDVPLSKSELDQIFTVLKSKNVGLMIRALSKHGYMQDVENRKDLEAIAIENLFCAVLKYDKSRGTAFSTIATSLMTAALAEEATRMINGYCSNHYASHAAIIRKAIIQINNKKGTTQIPEIREIHDYCATILGKEIPEYTIEKCLGTISWAEHESLEDIKERCGRDKAFTQSTAEDLAAQMARTSDLTRAINDLPPIHKYIMCMATGFGPAKKVHTIAQIAESLNKKEEYIRYHSRQKSKEKKFSAFYCETYFNQAVDILKNDRRLQSYNHNYRDELRAKRILSQPESIVLNADEVISVSYATIDMVPADAFPDFVKQKIGNKKKK